MKRALRTINMHQAKTHLSRLVEDVADGDEVIIARAGKPVARLVPAGRRAKRRKLGFLAGRLIIPDDFDAPLPDDVTADFDGEPPAPPR